MVGNRFEIFLFKYHEICAMLRCGCYGEMQWNSKSLGRA